MASVVNNNYNLPSGQTTLQLGIAISDVVGGVWTPTKSGGLITDASWAGLPLNSWVKVAGTKLTQIKDQLLAATPAYNPATMDFGNGKTIAVTFNAYTGQALDATNGISYIMCGGGHNDSSTNGIWALDLEKMGSDTGWRVESMPTVWASAPIPDYSTYQANAAANFMAWQPAATAPAEEVSYAWTDFIPNASDGLPYRPTARHQYQGVVYDSVNNRLVSTRISRWDYYITTKTYQRRRWVAGGTEQPLDTNGFGFCEFHAATNRIVGTLPRTRIGNGYNDLGYIAQGTSETNRVSLDSTVGSPVISNQNAAWTRVSEDLVLAVGNFSGGAGYGYLNLSTLTRPQAQAAIVNGMASSGDCPSLCFDPNSNKAYRRLNDGTGTWRVVDMNGTPTETAYTPVGNPPPFVTNPSNKMFYYPRRKVIVYMSTVNDTTDSIYVMRTG